MSVQFHPNRTTLTYSSHSCRVTIAQRFHCPFRLLQIFFFYPFFYKLIYICATVKRLNLNLIIRILMFLSDMTGYIVYVWPIYDVMNHASVHSFTFLFMAREARNSIIFCDFWLLQSFPDILRDEQSFSVSFQKLLLAIQAL